MYPLNVIATFNSIGEIKPLYVELEENRRMIQLRVIESYSADKKYAGTRSIDFTCVLENDLHIKLVYFIESHTWKSDTIVI